MQILCGSLLTTNSGSQFNVFTVNSSGWLDLNGTVRA